jgi:PAS domain S-box-containing protein
MSAGKELDNFNALSAENLLASEREQIEMDMMRLAAIVESSTDAIFSKALDGTITSWNFGAEKLYGYSSEEIIGQNVSILIPPDRPLELLKILELIKEGSHINHYETIRINKIGGRVDISLTISPVKNVEGKIVEASSIARDISDRKAAEKASIKLKDELQLAAQDYRRVLDNSQDVICQINKQGEFTKVSAAAKKVWGYEPEELIGRTFLELVAPDDRSKTVQIVNEVMMGHPTSTLENSSQHKDGSIVHTMWSANWSEPDQTMFCVARDISQIKQAEEALIVSEADYRSLIESLPAIVYLAQPFPPYAPIYVSPNITVFGYQPEEWFNRSDMWISLLHPDDQSRVLRVTEEAMNQGQETDLEYRIVTRDNQTHWVKDKGRFISDNQGNKTGWQRVILDVTKTKELEEQLRQAQKLESVGRLAGGIAHDFNNMLTAINGYSDLTLRRLGKDDPLRRNIEEIKKAGERSADLTHQLLAFSRQQILQPIVMDVNKTITDTINMLQRLIGEDIQLTATLNSMIGRVKVDPGQFSQIIINLAVNARDAMPEGGKLTIETANVFLEQNYTQQHIGILPGAYVMLAVSDTGNGMSDETKQHIFEPFFTTKEVGLGTGLGLATVYGIVKQSGGNIEVYSETAVGTTFKIYFPRVAEQVDEEKTTSFPPEMAIGTETILLVEDEELVRNLAREILEGLRLHGNRSR